jgi:hypothetical protein
MTSLSEVAARVAAKLTDWRPAIGEIVIYNRSHRVVVIGHQSFHGALIRFSDGDRMGCTLSSLMPDHVID